MNKMKNLLVRTGHVGIAVLLFLTLSHAQDYEPPIELDRLNGAFKTEVLVGEPTLRVQFSWHDDSNLIRLKARKRPNPTADWGDAATREESVAFYMTAVTPLYSERALLVIGVRGTAASPETVIEKWKIITGQVPGSSQFTVRATRAHVLTSPGLTHLWAAASAPDGSFLIGQNFETKELWKIDLPSGNKTIIGDPTTQPALQHLNHIAWMRHSTKGDCYVLRQVRGGHVVHGPDYFDERLYLWDQNEDGVPDQTELFSEQQEKAAGYADTSVWWPFSKFDTNRGF